MNIKRVTTTLIGFPIVILFLVLSNKYLIDIAFAIIALIAMREYTKCVSHKAKVISWIGYLSAISISLLHIIPIQIVTTIAIFGLPTLIMTLFLHVIISNMKITFEDISYTLIGILYIIGFVIFLPLIYGIEGEVSGKILIWYIIFSTWGTDVFAYLIGKYFGKHKFSKVSPNKTIEGCVAGTISAIIFCLVYTFFINKYSNLEISYITVLIISTVLSIIGQIGDFSASVVKRHFEIKDFSDLFPGHGGMIDRIDSVMYIAPFAYLLFTLFI